jgi:hypothetical protein
MPTSSLQYCLIKQLGSRELRELYMVVLGFGQSCVGADVRVMCSAVHSFDSKPELYCHMYHQ